MAISNLDVGQHLQVQTYWARRHQWKRGTTWNVRPIPAYVIWFVRQGVVNVVLDGKPFSIKAGDVWLHAYTPNRVLSVQQDADWLTLGLDAKLYENIDVLAPLAPAQWQPASAEPLVGWLEQLVETERAASWEGALIHNSLMRAVVAWCWKERGGSLEQLALEFLSPWLSKVLAAIRENLQMNISEHMAHSGYSPAQFRRHFKQTMKCSPHDYLTRIRMAQAEHLLETTSLSIWQISTEVGFPTQEHFARQFKKIHGVSPSQFRKSANLPKV